MLHETGTKGNTCFPRETGCWATQPLLFGVLRATALAWSGPNSGRRGFGAPAPPSCCGPQPSSAQAAHHASQNALKWLNKAATIVADQRREYQVVHSLVRQNFRSSLHATCSRGWEECYLRLNSSRTTILMAGQVVLQFQPRRSRFQISNFATNRFEILYQMGIFDLFADVQQVCGMAATRNYICNYADLFSKELPANKGGYRLLWNPAWKHLITQWIKHRNTLDIKRGTRRNTWLL